MVDQSVIAIVREYLEVLMEHDVPVAFAILYGSYARGDQRADSDIDVLVVSDAFDKDWPKWNRLLWELLIYVDYRIEPIPVTPHQLETDDLSMVIEMARREGIVIYPGDEIPPTRLDESGILLKARGG